MEIYISNFEKRLRQLENDHISTETGTSQENNKLDAVFSKVAGIYSKLDDFDERLKKIEENEGYNSFTTKPYEQTITQPKKSRYHTYEENESLYKNSPPQGAIIDEYSDSMAREKYKYTQGKIYLDVNKYYKQGRMENHDGINSIFSKSEFSTGSLFILIKDKLYFNFYRYNENKELPNTENESVMMEEIFDFRKDKYGRIKWCSPAIVELENGNYVVKHKGSVWIEK